MCDPGSGRIADGVFSADFSFTDADVSSLVPSLAASTGVCIGGLEVLGARVYDPATRGFLSRDPLVSPTGAGWASNVYAFAGFDPVGLVDPWGLTPVSREEFAQYAAEHPSGIAATAKGVGKWIVDNKEAIGMVAIGVVATVALGPVGGAIVGGAFISAGFSAATNKNPDGSIQWTKVGRDALFGAISGGAGAKAMSFAGKALAPHLSKVANGAASKATNFGSKAFRHGQKADNMSAFRPLSKGYHQWRQEANVTKMNKFNKKADTWNGRAQTAADPKKFGETVVGESVSGSATGATANGLDYTFSGNDSNAWAVREDWNPAGLAKATGGGSAIGLVAPVAPVLASKGAQGAVHKMDFEDSWVNSEPVKSVASYSTQRLSDYGAGVGDYWSTTDTEDLNKKDAQDKGTENTIKGAVEDLENIVPVSKK